MTSVAANRAESSLPFSLEKGARLPEKRTGPLTSSHIARWCAAQQNWDKIHYDQAYARDFAKLPGTVINGALKQHVIVQFLAEAFEGRGWVWRLDFRFEAMDLVRHELEVQGSIADILRYEGRTFVQVKLGIRNLDLDEQTTSGTAVVILPDHPEVLLIDVLDLPLPAGLRLDQAVGPRDASVPVQISSKLGSRLEAVESDYPVDLSRLRLFADAVMGLHPMHYDPKCAAAARAGAVVAPPLFPLHALEALPGKLALSSRPEALGREAVNEVGRDMQRHVGIGITWNGGNKVEVHSLVRVGERVAVESILVGASRRIGKRGGHMLFLETINRYREAGGRPLVTERQTMVCRMPEGEPN